jgi:hypothetical protein
MTYMPVFGRRVETALTAAVLLAAPMIGPVEAQEVAGPVAELQAGWVGFADDGIVSESLLGANLRWYVGARISVGPEILYLDGSNHRHLVATGNVTWDVLAPSTGRARRITPFVVAGAGLFQTRETFPSGPFTSNEGAFTAGGGLRGAAGERVTLGVDARVGWELHLRVNGFVGVQFGP